MGKNTAIVLAAGQGKRMGSAIPKQFLEMQGKPVVYYSLECFEHSDLIDEIILVTGADCVEYCRNEIVERYGFQKVKQVIEGGKERYDSVYQGLLACNDCSCVLIHDGARPFLTEEIIQDNLEAVREYRACVTAVPTKDTIKVAMPDQMVKETPDRKTLWNVQTPQSFDYQLILQAHEKMRKSDMSCVTDDSMMIEACGSARVRLVMGSYDNIKITTPEDLVIAENILNRRNA